MLINDREGKELAGLAEARGEAEALASQLRLDLTILPTLVDELHVEITDGAGKVLDMINLNGKRRFH